MSQHLDFKLEINLFWNAWPISNEWFSFLENKIISKGDTLNYIYFIEKGSVFISNYNNEEPMIYLPQYSFFGDYQVILDIQSNVTYHWGNSETVLFGLRKDLFLNLIQESCGHYDHPIEKDSDYKLTTFERVIKDIIKKEKPLRWSLYKFYYERAVIRRRVIRKIQKYSIQVDLKQEPDKSEPTDNFRDDSGKPDL